MAGIINKVDNPPPIAFPDKILQALAGDICEITDNGQFHPVIGKFLEYFARLACFQVKKGGMKGFTADHHGVA